VGERVEYKRLYRARGSRAGRRWREGLASGLFPPSTHISHVKFLHRKQMKKGKSSVFFLVTYFCDLK
jgi:hypothetical protein